MSVRDETARPRRRQRTLSGIPAGKEYVMPEPIRPRNARDVIMHKRFALMLAMVSVLFAPACSRASDGAGAVPLMTSPDASRGFVSTLAGSGRPKSVDGKGRNASFHSPTDIALNPATDTLYILEPPSSGIRSLTTEGVADTITRNLDEPTALAFDKQDGHLYTASAVTSDVMRVSTDGVISAFVHVPGNHRIPPDILGKIAFDATGTMQITEDRTGKLVGIAPNKKISYNVVGSGIFGICHDSKGFYVVNQTSGELGKVVKDGMTKFAASDLLQFTSGVTYDGDGNAFYVTDPQHNRILKVTWDHVAVLAGDGTAGEVDGPFGKAEFNRPTGIVYDHATRALYVVDSNGNTIRELSGL